MRTARAGCVIQRLDTHWIARQKQLASPAVPDRERENPIQMIDDLLTVFLVQVENHLRVGVRRESMSFAFEEAPQLTIVVDLAVEHDVQRAVFIGDQTLPAACGIL